MQTEWNASFADTTVLSAVLIKKKCITVLKNLGNLVVPGANIINKRIQYINLSLVISIFKGAFTYDNTKIKYFQVINVIQLFT